MNTEINFILYIKDKFPEFLTEIQQTFNIPEKTLRDILSKQDIQNILINSSKNKILKTTVDDPATPEQTCIAPLKSGARKDQPCGKKISKTSKTCKYCLSHVKLETISEVKEKQAEEIEGPLFRLNKWNNFAFGHTGLILKSATEKYVIGKQLSDGNIIDLSADDITLCKRRSLKYVTGYQTKNIDPSQGEISALNSNTISHTSRIAL